MGFRFGDPVGRTYNSSADYKNIELWKQGKVPKPEFSSHNEHSVTFPCGHRFILEFAGEGDYDWEQHPVCPQCNPESVFIVSYRAKGSEKWHSIITPLTYSPSV